MSRVRFVLVLLLALLAVTAYLYSSTIFSAPVTSAAPALQATASNPAAAPTPAPATVPQTAAPIGEGTQGALLILGLVVLSGLAIGGGIYLRRRWIATRY